jgi:hypothetical protein
MEYLYTHQSRNWIVTTVTGRTVTATICASNAGAPAAIGTLTEVGTEVTGVYTITFDRADLQSQLAAYLNKTVWLHIDDGVTDREVYPYRPTNVDPDLLEPLL